RRGRGGAPRVWRARNSDAARTHDTGAGLRRGGADANWTRRSLSTHPHSVDFYVEESGMADKRASEDQVALGIDAVTLQCHIDELGAIGTCPGGGLYRGVYTPSWTEARALVRAWLAEMGLATREDAVGNVFGRLDGTESQRVVLSGSHVDTVKQGGKYDGALGIHAAIAAIAALRAADGPPKKALEVYVGCEEEGSRFHCNFWGARAMTGEIGPDEVDALRDDDGTTIGDAMRACGLDPAAVGSARRDDLDA